MFEELTFNKIMERALQQVRSDVDKRQGSIIWDALAPACSEIAEMYIELDNILKLTYAETSFDEWLDKRCREMGVHREKATFAIRLGEMYGRSNTPIDIPIGTRFSIETINYVATERIETGKYRLTCEHSGKIGNHLFGRLIPIDNISGLTKAELTEVIIPGEEQETDEALYKRYVDTVNSTPFGGNIDDYKQKVRAIAGVYDCKVFPVWQGGGTVKITIINTEYKRPSDGLIEEIQQMLDPVPFNQQGLGLAPIGHFVTVKAVDEIPINIETNLVLKQGIEKEHVEEALNEIIKEYLLGLAREWPKEENLIVRINQLEARVLNISDILDISDTTLNGNAANITLNSEEIPIKGTVVINA